MAVDLEDTEAVGEKGFSGARRLLLAVGLGGTVLALGLSGLGLIPVPNSTGNATVMHVPAVLGGVFGGPFVGMFVGLVFGVFSWLDHSAPIFRDPVVAVVPRLLIGVVAWMAYVSLKDRSVRLAAVLAGVLGSFANTVGVLFLAVTLGYFPAAAVLPVLPQATVEAALAGLVLLMAVEGRDLYRRWEKNKSRDGSPDGAA